MARAIAKDARERARAAKRRVDAERAERDRLIEDAATAYYESAAIIDDATAQMHAAVNTLLNDLQEPVSRVATLLDLDPKELNKLKKAVTKSASKPAPESSSTTEEHKPTSESASGSDEGRPAEQPAAAQPAAGSAHAGGTQQPTTPRDVAATA